MKNLYPLKKGVVLFAAAVAAGQAAAQSQRVALEEVIVSAQKRTQSVTEVPISIQAFSADVLEKEKFERLGDLQFLSPSVQFSQGSAGNLSNTVFMRGLGSYSFEGGIQPSVATTIDGVPLSRSGEFSADLGDIERVEVVLGPQGTLYGRNSTGGVINVVRKGPTEEFESSVELLATDDDEYLAKFMISGSLSDSVRGRLNVLYRDRDDHIKNLSLDGGDDAGGEKTKGAVAKVEVDFTDSLNVLFTADYVDSETGGNPLDYFLDDPFANTTRVPVLGNGDPALGQKVLDDPFLINVNGSSPMWTDYDQGGFVADLTWNLSDAWTLHSLTSYREYTNEFAQEIDGTPASPTNLMGIFGVTINGTSASNLGRSGAENSFDYITQELRLEFNSENLSVISGMFLQKHDEDSNTGVPLLVASAIVQSDPVTNNFKQETWAVFGDATWNIIDDLELFGGLRWTDESAELSYRRDSFLVPVNPMFFEPCEGVCNVDLETFDSFVDQGLIPPPLFHDVVEFASDREVSDWSGRAGIKWQLDLDTNVYASYSRGFVGIGVNYTRTATPDNTWLEPSTADSFEIGFKSTLLDNSLQLNGALYYMEVADLQTTVRVADSITTVPINAGDLETTGMELTMNWAATANLLLEAGLAWTDAEIRDLTNDCYPGQTFEQGCNVPSADGSFVQELDGTPTPNVPEWKYTLAANYDLPLKNMPFDGYGRLSYVWQDESQSGLKQDPLTRQEDYGILNLVLGITDNEGRFDVSLFGRNITDEFFSIQRGEITALQAGYFQFTSRNAQAYWGVKANLYFD